MNLDTTALIKVIEIIIGIAVILFPNIIIFYRFIETYKANYIHLNEALQELKKRVVEVSLFNHKIKEQFEEFKLSASEKLAEININNSVQNHKLLKIEEKQDKFTECIFEIQKILANRRK